jgi:hypothetical protein
VGRAVSSGVCLHRTRQDHPPELPRPQPPASRTRAGRRSPASLHPDLPRAAFPVCCCPPRMHLPAWPCYQGTWPCTTLALLLTLVAARPPRPIQETAFPYRLRWRRLATDAPSHEVYRLCPISLFVRVRVRWCVCVCGVILLMETSTTLVVVVPGLLQAVRGQPKVLLVGFLSHRFPGVQVSPALPVPIHTSPCGACAKLVQVVGALICLTTSLCVSWCAWFSCVSCVRGVRYSYMGACDGPHAFYTSYSLAQREVTTWKRRGGKGQVQRRAYRLAADQSFFDVVDRKLAKRKCPIGTLLHTPPYPVVGGTPALLKRRIYVPRAPARRQRLAVRFCGRVRGLLWLRDEARGRRLSRSPLHSSGMPPSSLSLALSQPSHHHNFPAAFRPTRPMLRSSLPIVWWRLTTSPAACI